LSHALLLSRQLLSLIVISLTLLALINAARLRQIDFKARIDNFMQALANRDLGLMLLFDRHNTLNLALTLFNSLLHPFIIASHLLNQVLILTLLAHHTRVAPFLDISIDFNSAFLIKALHIKAKTFLLPAQ